MKICYLVLVHHKFDQALRMVGRLAGPNTEFVFHIDARSDPSATAHFRKTVTRELNDVGFAKRVKAKWGSYWLAVSALYCAEVGLRINADRYVLLSGQDYPIVSREEIVEFFSRNRAAEYIEAYPIDVNDKNVAGWSPYYRFRRYHVWIGHRRKPFPLLRKALPPIPLYHGSAWWALSHAALTYVVEQFRSNHRLRRCMRTGFFVEEAYVNSLMMASPFAHNITGHNVTFVQWTPTSGPHPKILRYEDLPQLKRSAWRPEGTYPERVCLDQQQRDAWNMSPSGLEPRLFARKFDAALDHQILDTLDGLHTRPAERERVI